MNYETKFLVEVLNIIQHNIADPDLNGAFISHELGMSRMNLHRLLRKHANTNASALILDLKIDYAKSALLNTENHILSIAKELGFKDASYFSKVFKRKMGCSPTEYRNR